MSPTQWALAIGCIVGAVFVLLVMGRHHLRSKFPFFFNYISLYIVIACIGLAAYLYNCTISYYVSWVLGSLMMLLEVAVIYEVLAATLKSYSALVDLAKILFRWAAAFLLLTGLVTALATNGQEATKMEAALTVVEHCIRLMQCGLLLFLLVFENRLGISWRNHGVAIALGLGVYAGVDLIASYVPLLPQRTFDFITGVAYLGSLALWGCILTLREPAPKSVLDMPSRLIFQRWNEALLATPLVARKNQPAFTPVESFLPGVEQTVERVMARKMMH
jgi:hypothetical protein